VCDASASYRHQMYRQNGRGFYGRRCRRCRLKFVHLKSAMKHILITGVSTGIGYAAAQAFIAKGYHVYGSVRKQADADMVRRQLGPQFSPLLFDVTHHAAIAEAAKNVEAEIGRDGLACLINNAGLSTSGPLMLQPLDDIRYQFEVNVIVAMSGRTCLNR
jgi:NAD(P)-dependent dehydrogenase (short-subunit alcohol dehydrogenase family)